MDPWGPMLVRTWYTGGQRAGYGPRDRDSFPELTVPSGQERKQARSAYVLVCVCVWKRRQAGPLGSPPGGSEQLEHTQPRGPFSRLCLECRPPRASPALSSHQLPPPHRKGPSGRIGAKDTASSRGVWEACTLSMASPRTLSFPSLSPSRPLQRSDTCHGARQPFTKVTVVKFQQPRGRRLG